MLANRANPRLRRRVALRIVAALAVAAAAAHAADARRPKKLIQTGWDRPDTARLRANLPEMENRPFDGVVIGAVGHTDQGRPCHLHWAFLDQKWRREWFDHCLANLKACKFARLTDNFLLFGANPGNVDWFDDPGWANIVAHWRIAAWLARQGGLKGILFDPEAYAPPHAQFRYSAQPQRNKHPFDAYAAKARERGRQVMAAVVQEFPDITLFCYFMNSVVATATGRADPNPILKRHPYGLLPAFIDGWLDAAPPAVTFVDGCEMAYRYNSVVQYLEAAVLVKGPCQELVSPENRAKYRAQVQVGFGIYLDAYWNPPTSPWYIDGLGGSRVERLRANVRTALRVADEYVWVYGEKFRWWPTPNKRVNAKTWPEALPGCEKVLRFARDPIAFAKAQIAERKAAGTLANLARNGDFASPSAPPNKRPAPDWQKGRAPAGWHSWQTKDSHGTFTWDRQVGAKAKGSARAAGVADGCFIQAHEVEPGELYAIGATRRLQGKGDAWIRVRWQTREGKWTAQTRDVVIACDGPRAEWAEMFGVVEVPEGAGRMVLLLCVADQPTADDIAWFDDIRVHKLQLAP